MNDNDLKYYLIEFINSVEFNNYFVLEQTENSFIFTNKTIGVRYYYNKNQKIYKFSLHGKGIIDLTSDFESFIRKFKIKSLCL